MDLPADVARATKEWVLPLDRRSPDGAWPAWILRPGSRLGRAQRADVDASSRRRGRDAGERVVGLWVPGDQPALLPAGAAWTIEPDTELVVRVSYRKRWDREREPASDQSTVGLYFTSAAGRRGHRAVTLRAGDRQAGEAHRRRHDRPNRARQLPCGPSPPSAGATVRVETVTAGRRALARGDACAAGRVGAPLLAEAAARASGGDAAGSQSRHGRPVTAAPRAAETPLLGRATPSAAQLTAYSNTLRSGSTCAWKVSPSRIGVTAT